MEHLEQTRPAEHEPHEHEHEDERHEHEQHAHGQPAQSDRPLTPEEAGRLRERLREQGWRSDVGWMAVGAGSSGVATHHAGGAVRRTIAYLPSLRAVDGGASRVWKDGDVPAPEAADAREVMVAEPDASEWQSELLEAPIEK